MKYSSKLTLLETEQAVKFVKDSFEKELSKELHLVRVSAPLFLLKSSGLNDDLSGVERSVSFDILETGAVAEVVHSLAKWKRYALSRYDFPLHDGIYTDMNAIRRDETCDEVHSLYVDQWDWEQVICEADRNVEYLKKIVRRIYRVMSKVSKMVEEKYPQIPSQLPDEIYFITSQELENKYPELSPHQREDAIAKEHGAVFIIGIGGKLASGEKHDGRAPDYDDWKLNGDILVYYPLLERSIELSSMGIRVDKESLWEQLTAEGKEERAHLTYHKALLEDRLPLTIGGGIGQSRMCMIMLHKAHIGEVQASIWPEFMVEECNRNNVFLL